MPAPFCIVRGTLDVHRDHMAQRICATGVTAELDLIQQETFFEAEADSSRAILRSDTA